MFLSCARGFGWAAGGRPSGGQTVGGRHRAIKPRRVKHSPTIEKIVTYCPFRTQADWRRCQSRTTARTAMSTQVFCFRARSHRAECRSRSRRQSPARRSPTGSPVARRFPWSPACLTTSTCRSRGGRSPRRSLVNCTSTGWSMPSSAWQLATARGSKLPPPEPRRTTQMSPGVSRISKNTSADEGRNHQQQTLQDIPIHLIVQPNSQWPAVVELQRLADLERIGQSILRRCCHHFLAPDFGSWQNLGEACP
jgi:hypothetical protein